MTITYYSGSTFNQVIGETIKSMNEMLVEPQIEDHQDFYKYIKQNIVALQEIDCFVLDVSACLNTEEELLLALEMVRTMYDDVRIVVFAPDYHAGDPFLKKCFEMGIMNIITTDDYKKLQEEIVYCINKGMSYRDAAKYKEAVPDKITVRHAVRKAVNKRMIGVAGAESNIGTTHNAIVLANYFRQKGYMVALVEKNSSHAFEEIRESFDEKAFEEGYFTINGVDFYPSADDEKVQAVQEHSYNVIIVDFGCFNEWNKDAFERCEDKIIIAGSRPWEMEATSGIFPLASKDVLAKYIWCFNFTPENEQEAIRDGMGTLENVHFLSYTNSPFEQSEFADGDLIFAEILPEEPKEEEKKGIAKLFKNRKQDKE